MMQPLKKFLPMSLLLVFVWSLLPYHAGATQKQSLHHSPTRPEPEASVGVTKAPLAETRQPGLGITIDVSPNPLTVGDEATIQLTIANTAPYGATNLVVELPFPQGATPIDQRSNEIAQRGWHWKLNRLDGKAQHQFTARVRITTLPPGAALVVRPQVTAHELGQPIRGVGGALVTPLQTTTSSADVVRNQPATLINQQDRISVTFPAELNIQPLKVTYVPLRDRKQAGSRTNPGMRRGFGAFALHATDMQGAIVHQFAQPVTMSIGYTTEQLDALGMSEADLTLFWFDDQAQRWIPQPTIVDPETHTVRASVNRASTFELGDGSAPSEAFIPSLQGWQVGLFSGGVNFNLPIDLPSGPAGIKPQLSLSYSSSSADGKGGLRPKQQAGWIGSGWSLDTGSVAANTIATGGSTTVRYYSLVINGQSFDLVRGAALVANPSPERPADWEWMPTNEAFNKISVIEAGNSTTTRGGFRGTTPYKRYLWQIWTKDGTRYEFSEDLWWGFEDCMGGSGDYASMEAYKWNLSRIIDVHGNTITYGYGRDAQTRPQTCFQVQGTVDRDSWPTTISWGGNSITGAVDRYKVEFISSVRANDTAFDGATNQYGGVNGHPRQTRRLDALRILSMPAGTWELMRQYTLAYDYSLLSDNTVTTNGTYTGNTAYPKLTLKSIQRVAKDGMTVLPPMTFSYGTTRGTAQYPHGDWNRLTTVNNGQGGTTHFAYENLGMVTGNSWLANYRRVTSKTTSDGQGNNDSWSYSYSNPALNSLGSLLDPTPGATQAYANSATLYYNTYSSVGQNNSAWLLRKAASEFRGHSLVVETDPSGHQTDHYFYQGDVNCNPVATGAALTSDPCFLQLRDREILKGKEYRTVTRQGTNKLLRETLRTYAVEFYTYSATPLTGLWRSFNYERETQAKTWEGNATPNVQRTVYSYDPASQGGTQYGNLTRVEEYDTTGALYRRTDTLYAINTTTAYLVGQRIQETVRNGAGAIMALSSFMYDGATSNHTLGSRGLLTMTRKYFDIPSGISSTTGLTLQSVDVSYSYDSYGNQTAITTYKNPGTRLYNGSTTIYSVPGNGSASATITTGYDTVFHAFPIQVAQPTVNGLTLTELAGYDFHMGTMTSVTDVNGQVTAAEYDQFGRMVKLIKPGDTSTLPTLHADYGDTEIPLRYTIHQRQLSGVSGAVQTQSQFYDGIGRKIQTKNESIDDTQAVVVDLRYNAQNQLIAQSQPRFVGATASTLTQYTPVSNSGIQWTTTTYDALSRPLDTVTPNGATTQTRYWWSDGGSATTITDPNGHKTRRESDSLGRLLRVIEYSGNSSGTEGAFATYATTTYNYTTLDLLAQVIDAQGNTTTLTYDSLGRKTMMSDPDMGSWMYAYDTAGNLVSQTDAKNQTINFTYDTLNRLTAKDLPGTSGDVNYIYDQTDAPTHTYGKGLRTGMIDASGTHEWGYTSRGQVAREAQTVVGSPITYVTERTYRADGKLTTMTYPTGEVLNYGYTMAGQKQAVSSSLGITYQTGASYDALGQPLTQSYGNGVTTTSVYNPISQRLQELAANGSAGNVLHQEYLYDLAGNVQTVKNFNANETLLYRYDHRNRLVSACVSNGVSCLTKSMFNQSYSYDLIGNLTMKAGTAYSYTSSKPHAVTNTGGTAYSYDANGNLLAGAGRTYTWNAENQPTQITSGGVSETYLYDGNNTRVKKTTLSGGVTTTTTYIGGIVEYRGNEVISNYDTIAVRSTTGNPTPVNSGSLVYLHADHLGSISATTSGNSGTLGAIGQTQSFDPWGAVRSGGITTTEFNFTGQRKDASTGLLFYNARYFDPVLARFISADSLVPTTSHRALTVDFHEAAFAATLADENQRGFWFQMGSQQRQQATPPWGPTDPQNLNRFSYATNNPLRFTDPSGHVTLSYEEARELNSALTQMMPELLEAYKNAKNTEDLMKGINIILARSPWYAKALGKFLEFITTMNKDNAWERLEVLAWLNAEIDKFLKWGASNPKGAYLTIELESWASCSISVVKGCNWVTADLVVSYGGIERARIETLSYRMYQELLPLVGDCRDPKRESCYHGEPKQQPGSAN
ncbi:RHS repeat-associated core domain-containing protein [Herpetosiphon gulosus]|uniref:DUF11 domain-containing protein n=1 Tax=Herpetosiphon gulosus TaxID=1973496 RepID=A0ABP9XA60_9CHLR